MGYKIEYLPASEADLESIFDYIHPRNTTSANKILDTLYTCIGELKNFPKMGKILLNRKYKSAHYRVLIVENYYVFYIVREAEKVVRIYRILSTHQNYLKWLDDMPIGE